MNPKLEVSSLDPLENLARQHFHEDECRNRWVEMTEVQLKSAGHHTLSFYANLLLINSNLPIGKSVSLRR